MQKGRRMARKRKKRPLRPRTPSRVKKRTRKGATRSHQHPELIGLAMVAFGLFLATSLYLGWDGGVVGTTVVEWLDAAIGSASYVAPVAFVGVGGLMLFRSALVDVRPFRTGLVVWITGLMVTLGSEHGGAVGSALGGGLARLVGETGSLIVGVTLLVAGTLLLTGASAGAILRRSGHVVRRAHTAARRSRERASEAVDELLLRDVPPQGIHHEPPVDVASDYPDVLSDSPRKPPRTSSPRRQPHAATTSCRTAPCSRPPHRPTATRRRRGRGSPGRSSRRSPTSASRRRSSARSPARA